MAFLVLKIINADWDPIDNSDWQKQIPTRKCIVRVKKDIMSIYKDPPTGIFIVPEEEDIMLLHALIAGPFGTPYECGFFYFIIRFPPDYPSRPPRVKLMTTGGGKVYFNPNLYNSGKVCLSILDTWEGPSWSPAQSLSSVLVSIQSLFNDKPYHNEPGFETELFEGDADKYNELILHENIRVAVCGMLENDTGINIPETFLQVMRKIFLEFYECYEGAVVKKMNLNGRKMYNPFTFKYSGRFQYRELLTRLKALRDKYITETPADKKAFPGSNCSDECTGTKGEA